ncbi:UNVERIFIED_CONTAM: Ripening-related protein 3 [Sesamum latifolium]|uniref:Ripening-related protein 3 n=1 Tax=Sesamum latifolium TaxID=2727402 RepID=A0AAW2YGG4_9LAMI
MRNLSLGAFLLVILLFSSNSSEARIHACKPSGKVKGKKPPPDHCNEDDSICCIKGRYYTTYKCSPQSLGALRQFSILMVLRKAEMAISHPNAITSTIQMIQKALSTGCHDYLPPCDNNIVGASKAVWKALGVPLEDWGELDITWSDA